MTHLEGIAHWLKYELDVDVLLTSDLACALERLRQAEERASASLQFEAETGLPAFEPPPLVTGSLA
jgi:hypothetical protein